MSKLHFNATCRMMRPFDGAVEVVLWLCGLTHHHYIGSETQSRNAPKWTKSLH